MSKEKRLSTEQKLKDLNVTVLNSKPAIFDRCEKEFGISWENTIFAVYPHIHTKYSITDDVIEHELVHMQQQIDECGDMDVGLGVEYWWNIYFKDKEQRLKWELEAYKVQYKFLKQRLGREELFKKVHFWASNLSGKGYGYLIGLQEAIKEITS